MRKSSEIISDVVVKALDEQFIIGDYTLYSLYIRPTTTLLHLKTNATMLDLKLFLSRLAVILQTPTINLTTFVLRYKKAFGLAAINGCDAHGYPTQNGLTAIMNGTTVNRLETFTCEQFRQFKQQVA